MRLGRITAATALLAGLAATTAAAAGLWQLTTDLVAAAGRGGTTLDESLGLVAVLGCWLCVGWVLLATACSVLAAVPGAAGRGFAKAADAVAPWTLRRVVAASLGLSIVAGPAAAAAPPSSIDGARTSLAVAAQTVDRQRLGTNLPPLDRPADAASVITVVPGDCLWSIAARQLGPAATDAEIALAWPRWYAANRAVIGPDPNLLQPGQRLVAPG